ncbi:MAG: hypothetical protein JNM30_16835 [Rhodospirillales bacterium]|nr:hypothetical protein [Rhodospirillales bacterium]
MTRKVVTISWRGVIAGIALFLAVSTAQAPQAAAQEPVAVTGDASGGKTRLTFDWQTPATFSAEIFDGHLIVRFARPFAASLDAAARALAPHVGEASIRPDGRTAVFALKGDKTFRTSQFGGRVVIDLVDRDASKAAEKPQPAKAAPVAAAPKPAKAEQPKPEPKIEPKVARVRLGESAEGTRLEIDWGKPVKFQADENGRNVKYSFDTPMQLDLGDLKDRALKLVEGLDAGPGKGGPALSLTLADKAQPRTALDGNRFILDIRPASGAPAKAEAPKPEPPKAEAAKAEKATAPPTALTLPQPAPQQPAAEPPPTSAQALTPVTFPPAPAQAAPAGPASQPNLLVGLQATPNKATLRFPWTQPVAAAAFRRGDQIWIVFDGQTKLDLQRIVKAPATLYAGAAQLPHEDMTVLRMTAAPSMNPTLARDGNAWLVEIRHQSPQPDAPIAVEPRAGADGKTVLSLAVDQPGRVARLRDPDIGDRLVVVPVATAGQGVAGLREYAEFRLLGSNQGVAVEPIADDIVVTAEPGQVTIGTPDGLMLSSGVAARKGSSAPATTATAAAPAPASSTPSGPKLPPEQVLFDFPRWSQAAMGDFTDRRRAKNLELANAPPEARNAARLDNGRFYFANLLPQDALGALERMEVDAVPETSEAPFKALKGATLAMSRKHDDAAALLADPRLDDNLEAQLWRGFVAANRGDLAKADKYFLAAGQNAPETYPLPLRREFGLKALEAKLAAKDVKQAQVIADSLTKLIKDGPDKGQLDFLRGNLMAALGKHNEAMRLWHDVASRRELPAWPRAEMALIEQGLATKTLKPAGAIERLEKLRYVWRGDALERRVLEMLAQLNLQVGENAAGLQNYRELATLFPESPEARNATDAMSKAFARLFIDGEADAMPPLKALSLYDSFRELTPSGAKGDTLIRNLADRVAAIDLLDRAAELLDDLVRNRLQGNAKGEAGARLASIRLQNNQVLQALQALDASRVETLPAPVRRERALLRAQAMATLDMPEQALALVAGDDSEPADKLRQDILWRQGDWPKVAQVASRRADRLMAAYKPEKGKPQPKPSDEAAAAVMSAAVAAQLGKDNKLLADLRDRYAAAMDQSGQKSAFRLIANGSGAPTDLAGIQQALDAATNFQKSLAGTRPAAGPTTLPKTN